MTSEKQEREASIAAITIALLLVFGAVSLTVSYLAIQTGVLFDGGGAIQPTIAPAGTD
jgi:hypothetical protein